MNDAYNIQEATKGFGKKQSRESRILRSLYLSPQPIEQFSVVRKALHNLQGRGLIEIKNDQVSLTELGIAVCEYWKEQNIANFGSLPKSEDEKVKELSKREQSEDEKVKEPSKREQSKQARLERSNQFFELYKQGITYQDIGDQNGVSKETVRQILHINPSFRKYLQEREKAEAIAEQEKKERAKQELYAKSLAARYPERVAELWDDEKNESCRIMG